MKITTKQLQQIIQEEILKEEWTDALDPKRVLDKAKEAAEMAADDGKTDPKAALAPEEPKEKPKPLTADQLIQRHIKLVGDKLDLLKFPTRREVVSIKGKKQYKFTASAGNVVAPFSANPTRKYYGNSHVDSIRSVAQKSSVRKSLYQAYKKAAAAGLGKVFVGVVKPGGDLKGTHTREGVAPMTSGTAQKTGTDWMFFATSNIVRVNKEPARPQGKVIEVILSLDAKGELIFIPHPKPTLSDWAMHFK